jgi:hypothetical protein
MTYKDNTPTYNVNRKVVNFKDFDPKSEKEELETIKKSYKKNELEKGQKERKTKYNKITRKLDDLDKSEVEDKLDSLKESIDHSSNWKEFKEFLYHMDFDLYDGEKQLHNKFVEICNMKLSPSEKSEKICSYMEDSWGLYDSYRETKVFLENLISKSESVKENILPFTKRISSLNDNQEGILDGAVEEEIILKINEIIKEINSIRNQIGPNSSTSGPKRKY